MTKMCDCWEGCYDLGWVIVPEAYSHPAKFSRGLIHRIYEHAKEMGWVKPGDYVLDPFGGVALGGLDAMGMGLNWIGVELEEKFVKLGEQNISLWNRQLAGWPKLGTARIIQGDSRRLRDVIREAGLIISSPPYVELGSRDRSREQYSIKTGRFETPGKDSQSRGYNPDNPSNLANLKEGNFQDVIEKADLVVSSPNFPTDQPCPSQTKAKKNYMKTMIPVGRQLQWFVMWKLYGVYLRQGESGAGAE